MLEGLLRYFIFYSKDEILEIGLIVLGTYIILETILSLMWPNNDKSIFAQGARVTRIFAGMIIIALAALISGR